MRELQTEQLDNLSNLKDLLRKLEINCVQRHLRSQLGFNKSNSQIPLKLVSIGKQTPLCRASNTGWVIHIVRVEPASYLLRSRSIETEGHSA